MTCPNRRSLVRRILIGLTLMIGPSGCGVTFDLPVPGVGVPNVTPTNVITVNLSNQHPRAAVDVELFAAATAVSDFDAELFLEANKVTGIGFAGTGFIPSRESDSVTIACGDAVVIGTSGAQFVDADTGDSLGMGERRILVRDEAFVCGDIITFTFVQTEFGFATQFSVE